MCWIRSVLQETCLEEGTADLREDPNRRTHNSGSYSTLYWVAVEELNLSDHNPETIFWYISILW